MLIVDRIEGKVAVLEKPDRTTAIIPLSLLPVGLKEGDCLTEQHGRYRIDQEETARRRKRNQALFQRLAGKDPED